MARFDRTAITSGITDEGANENVKLEKLRRVEAAKG